MRWAPFYLKPLDEWFMAVFGTLRAPTDKDLARLDAAIAQERRSPRRTEYVVSLEEATHCLAVTKGIL